VTTGAERRAIQRPGRESRHRAREATLQMLYQWEVGRVSMDEVHATFWSHVPEPDALGDDLRDFAAALAEGVVNTVGDLDALLGESAANWRVERMNVMDRLILRLAVYELLHEPATPAKVVINEALELARTFSGDESVRFVNGVLDAVRRKLQRE
jgi:N utilization substance protein B